MEAADGPEEIEPMTNPMNPTTRTTVLDAQGRAIDYEAAVNLMDHDLCETLNATGRYPEPQAFLVAYAEAHRERFGEDFAPAVGGAW